MFLLGDPGKRSRVLKPALQLKGSLRHLLYSPLTRMEPKEWPVQRLLYLLKKAPSGHGSLLFFGSRLKFRVHGLCGKFSCQLCKGLILRGLGSGAYGFSGESWPATVKSRA